MQMKISRARGMVIESTREGRSTVEKVDHAELHAHRREPFQRPSLEVVFKLPVKLCETRENYCVLCSRLHVPSMVDAVVVPQARALTSSSNSQQSFPTEASEAFEAVRYRL